MSVHNALVGIALGVGILVGAAGAQAGRGGEVSTCVREAAGDFAGCGAEAREAHQAATDLCLMRDHQCVEVCRAGRAGCVDDTGIEGVLRGCSETLEDARETCRGLFGPGTAERDTCIDQAQVVGFQCRDGARETAKPALRVCRTTFKSCARACGPADPLDPLDPVNMKQCRLDAKVAFAAAKANCREEFQFSKDACRNRDHDCVEACRAIRHDCTGPIFDAFEVAKQACNVTRDVEFANCGNLYADGTPERDACIDQAQVTAFVCRDDAREVARPQIQACRVAFRGCVQACPAPAPAP